MASTRFPGKPLHLLAGKPMIQWVHEAAVAAGLTDRIIVAAPDPEILEICESFGAEAVLTRADHPSGTDRLAEVAAKVEARVYVNLQGDEPLIDPANIRACAEPLLADPSIQMGSLYAECPAEAEDNPAVVKVVLDRAGYALYFSRHAIPFPRSPRQGPLWRHLGIYAFRRDTLLAFAGWKPTPLEQTENLEQLRFLENGVRIRMSRGSADSPGVDTPEQATEADRLLRMRLG
ncbi:MAG: 3-deoxy-manno-octulosonate cytidylyltransferase [Fimbriimonadaceae bacterium]|nr:3-deoxy-manno-octulosonate cytidylyltransferase [Fimbriimonadaceae bacterium]